MKKPEPIGTRKSLWGEGPAWHNGRLLYVDIHAHLILEFDPESGEENQWQLDQQVGFVAPCESGQLLFGGDNGLFYLDRKSGECSEICDPEPDLPHNRFNDGKCSPDGRLFAGTIAQDKVTGAAKLYRLDPDLSLSVAYAPVTNSNGLAWSADKGTLYYIDTPTKQVKAFDYDASSGEIHNERVVIDTSPLDGSPDGMTIDAEDHLWIAFCHGGRVSRFDPATGKEVETLSIPAHETTACTFGGPDCRDLYITTGTAKDQEEEFGGSLFVVRGLPVGGRPASVFKNTGS